MKNLVDEFVKMFDDEPDRWFTRREIERRFIGESERVNRLLDDTIKAGVIETAYRIKRKDRSQ